MSDLSFLTGVSSLLTVEQCPPLLCSGRRKSQFHLQFPFQLFLCFTLVQIFSSVVQSCLTLCNPMNQVCQASLSITNSWSPPKPMSIESVMPSNNLILCCPLLLPSIFPSISSWHEVAKVSEFQLQHQSFQ